MSSALEEIVVQPPSEYGGARADNRLGYQKDWILCLLIQLHLDGNDYLVVCDYHDDVLHFPGAEPFSLVNFFQIKTRSDKHWNISDLISQKDGKVGKLPSILGKLYRHKINFPTVANTITFSSNSPLNSAQIASPANTETFTFQELSSTAQTTLKAALRKEFALTLDPVLDASFVFHLSEMSHRGHRQYAKGRLEEFLSQRYPDRAAFPIKALYASLFDEISRKSSCESGCVNVIALKSLKGITKNDFETFITRAICESEQRDTTRLEKHLRDYLSSSTIPIGKQVQIIRNFNKYSIEKMNKSQHDLAACSRSVKVFCRQTVDGHMGTFVDLLAAGLSYFKTHKVGKHRDDSYLMAIVAWEVLSDEWRIPSTGT